MSFMLGKVGFIWSFLTASNISNIIMNPFEILFVIYIIQMKYQF